MMSSNSTNTWENAELGDSARKEKFMRLMGGGKKTPSEKYQTESVVHKGHDASHENVTTATITKSDNAETEEALEVSSANAWEKVDMDTSRRNKFLRLMGAAKKEHTGKFVIGDKEEEEKREAGKGSHEIEEGLEQQYNQGLGLKLSGASRRHRGFGYQEPPKEEENPPESADNSQGASVEDKNDKQREDRYDSKDERERDRHHRDYRYQERDRGRYQHDSKRDRSGERNDEQRDRKRYDREEDDCRGHRDRHERGRSRWDKDDKSSDRNYGNQKREGNQGYQDIGNSYKQNTGQYAGQPYKIGQSDRQHDNRGNQYGAQSYGQNVNTVPQLTGQAVQMGQSGYNQTGNITNQYGGQSQQSTQPVAGIPTGVYGVQYRPTGSNLQYNTHLGYPGQSANNYQSPPSYANPYQSPQPIQHAGNTQQVNNPISASSSFQLPAYIDPTAPPPPPPPPQPEQAAVTTQAAAGGQYANYTQMSSQSAPPPATGLGQSSKKAMISFVKSSNS